jgi:hypothetical protein
MSANNILTDFNSDYWNNIAYVTDEHRQYNVCIIDFTLAEH